MRIISGQYKGRVLKTLNLAGYRPAMGKVRESLFSMLEARNLLPIDANVLDLYAASGSLGFECLSRGAKHCTFVELDKNACQVLDKNIKMLGANANISSQDVSKYLAQKLDKSFAAIFVDPPYRENKIVPTLNSIIKKQLLADDGILVIEIEKELSFDPALVPFELISDKCYGQTRIIIWKNSK